MPRIDELRVRLVADTGTFISGMKNVQGTLKGTVTFADQARAGFSRFQASIVALNQAAQLVGTAFRGVAAVGRTIFSSLNTAAQAGADLGESLNKARVIFGDSAAGIDAFAKTAANALGLTRQEATEASASFGNMFKTTGIAKEAAADMSVAMVRLASDMASFNNEDPTEMLQRLRSGLAGEAEPLRRFGVLLSEAAVKAEAMRVGIGSGSGALTEAQKVQARYSLILRQTVDQQGDFARTADGLANAQRRLNAVTEDLRATFGSAISESKGVQSVFVALAETIEGLTVEVGDSRDMLIEFVDQGVVAIVDSLDELGEGLVFLTRQFEVFGRAIQSTVNPAAVAKAALEGTLTPLSDQLEAIGPRIGEFQDRFREAFERLRAEAAKPITAGQTNIPPITIDVEGDTSGLEQSVEQATKKLGAKPTAVPVVPEIDQRAFLRFFRDAQQELQNRRLNAAVLLDTDKALGSLQVLGRAIDETTGPRAVAVTADVDDARFKLTALEGFIVATTRKRDPVVIEARTDEARARLAEIRTILGTLPEKERIAVEADVSRVELQLAAIPGKIRDAGGSVPVDADTSEAEEKIDRLRVKLGQLDREFSSLRTGEGVQVFGDLASNAEIATQQVVFFQEALDAINEGSLPELRRLLAAGNTFVRDFGQSIVRTGGSINVVNNALIGLSQRIQQLGGAFSFGANALHQYAGGLSAITAGAGAATSSLSSLRSSIDDAGGTGGKSFTVGFNLQGSPALPASEYLTRFLPQKFEEAARMIAREGITAPLALPAAGFGRGGTGHDETAKKLDVVADRIERLIDTTEEQTRNVGSAVSRLADRFSMVGFVSELDRIDQRRSGRRWKP